MPAMLQKRNHLHLTSISTTHKHAYLSRIPTNPLPPDNSPHPDLSTPQIPKPEAFHPRLLFLSALFPSPDLLLGAVPIDNNSDVRSRPHTHIHGIRFVHGAVFALQLGIAQSDNVARTNLVELLDRGVGEVGVDEGAVGSSAHGSECVGKGFEEIEDEGVGRAIADDVVLFGGCGFGHACAVLLPCGFELVLAETGWGRFVSLLERHFLRILTVVASCDDGLAVVDEQNVNVFCDCRSATASLGHILLDFEKNITSVLEDWWRSVGLCPPERGLCQVNICSNVAILRGSANIHAATHVH